MKRVLMTNYFFAKFTGSELHILEVARLFEKQGYDVTIAVYQKAYPLLEKAGTIHVVDILNEELEYTKYDIVFVQHYPILDYLCCRYDISYKKLIVSKLSVISELEYLPVCTDEADLILCVSEECAEDVRKTVKDSEKVHVFKNSVSEEFFRAYSKKRQSCQLKKIAIISNHIPMELQKFGEMVSEQYEVDYIGIQYSPRLVDADLLKQYDLIITIGRTVQQCFAAGIPVYVYDYFGGPGYINEENFNEAERNNFSGRGNFGRKTAQELKDDVQENYERNLSYLEKLKLIATKDYSYVLNFQQIYQKLMEKEVNDYKQLEYYSGIEKQRMSMYSQIAQKYALDEVFVSQLYFDYGDGFKEDESITWSTCEGYEITRTFCLERPITRFRFDPCNIPSECYISEICLNGKIAESYTGIRKKFFDSDPQFIIELGDEEKRLDNLKIKIVYKFNGIHGEDAMNDCVKDNISLQNQLAFSQVKVKELEETIVAIKEYYKLTPKNIIKRVLNIFKR